MFILKRQQILLFICLTFFWVLGLTQIGCAELPVVGVNIPQEWGIHPQKVIFSNDGNKFALLVEEASEEKIRAQAIVVYDFTKQEWVKAASLTAGLPWTLEPLAFDQNGAKLAIRLRDDLIVYDVLKNTLTHNIEDVGTKTQVAFSPNGRFLAFLTNAEWETPTSLALANLLEEDAAQLLGLCVAYNGDSKAAGPLTWGESGEIFYIEEFTWGSINSRGILKQYLPDKGSTAEVYNTKSATARVADYSFSPDYQHIAIVLRDLQDDMKTSRYGLLIRTPETFVYGQMLPGWVDELDTGLSEWLSTSGWIGNEQFYWVNRSQEGSDLCIYHLGQNKVYEFHTAEQVYVSPKGVILKLER